MKTFEIITMLTGIAMSLGYFPQAYKIYRSKSADNISISMFAVFAVGTFIWTTYSLSIGDIALALGLGLGVIGSWLVCGLAVYYKK